MVQAIDPGLKLAELLKDDPLDLTAVGTPAAPSQDLLVSNNPFEDILAKAVDALEGVSQQEAYANSLIDGYVNGEADLQKVMVETAKANMLVNLTVTVVNTTVQTFKEVTQMQV